MEGARSDLGGQGNIIGMLTAGRRMRVEGARSDLGGQGHVTGMLTAGEKRGGGWREQGVILVDRVTS